MTREYSETVAAVDDVLRRSDPWGLISLGAPDDEYSSYAPEVARLLIRGDLSAEALAQILGPDVPEAVLGELLNIRHRA